jgi:hypothetical protein
MVDMEGGGNDFWKREFVKCLCEHQFVLDFII